MSLHLVTERVTPLPPYTCEMIDIDVEAIPFMLGSLYTRSLPYYWDSPDDEMYGRWLMNKEMVRLLMPCSRVITNLLEAQYNLLDGVLRGTIRDVTGTGTDIDPYVYEDPIPQVIDPIVYLTPGMQYNSVELLRGMYNLMNGTLSANYSDPRNVRQQLDDILAALEAETSEETTELLQKILIALGGVV